MKDLKLIDVTLRDGGYRTKFHFAELHVEQIVKSLDASGIDYIEIGYRKGSLHPIENIGVSGLCSNEYIIKCKKLAHHSKIAVMFHPQNITLQDINELADSGADLLRICVTKEGYEKSFPFIERAKACGLEVSVNITRLSRYSELELNKLVSIFKEIKIDMIYFADSNGSMLPTQIEPIYKKMTDNSSVHFGFHAHDNLGMAQANTLAAWTGGATYLDASLMGMGKGVGNLKMLEFISYLHAIKISKYDMDILLNLSNFIRKSIKEINHEISINEIMMGVADLTLDDIRNSTTI